MFHNREYKLVSFAFFCTLIFLIGSLLSTSSANSVLIDTDFTIAPNEYWYFHIKPNADNYPYFVNVKLTISFPSGIFYILAESEIEKWDIDERFDPAVMMTDFTSFDIDHEFTEDVTNGWYFLLVNNDGPDVTGHVTIINIQDPITTSIHSDTSSKPSTSSSTPSSTSSASQTSSEIPSSNHDPESSNGKATSNNPSLDFSSTRLILSSLGLVCIMFRNKHNK
jgi:hypothetical protein